VAVGALFVLFGSVLSQVKPNWFVGIRTPWTTLEHRSRGARTHRWAMALHWPGVLFAVTGLFKLGSFGYVVIGGALAAGRLGWSSTHYFVWRSDPDRRTTPGEPPTGQHVDSAWCERLHRDHGGPPEVRVASARRMGQARLTSPGSAPCLHPLRRTRASS